VDGNLHVPTVDGNSERLNFNGSNVGNDWDDNGLVRAVRIVKEVH
jgi:hypothetical protein